MARFGESIVTETIEWVPCDAVRSRRIVFFRDCFSVKSRGFGCIPGFAFKLYLLLAAQR
jgi:hypothetical protein